MKTIWMKKAQKYLDKSPKGLQTKVMNALSKIEKNFPNVMACQHVEKMEGAIDLFRYRVGAYRILFSAINDSLYVIDIGPRGDIYK